MNLSLRRATSSQAAHPTTPTGSRDGSLRAGGVAALVQAATFVFGFAIYGTVIASANADVAIDPAAHAAFVADHQLVLHVWYAVIYLLFGGALVVLAPIVGDRVKANAPVLARTATVFALIWATLMFAVGMSAIVGNDMVVALHDSDPTRAAALSSTIELLIEGLGGGVELVGGLWVALLSVAALRTGVFPKTLNRLGVVTGAAGISTTALLANDIVGAVFGLGSIIWFTWLGIHLVRTARAGAVSV